MTPHVAKMARVRTTLLRNIGYSSAAWAFATIAVAAARGLGLASYSWIHLGVYWLVWPLFEVGCAVVVWRAQDISASFVRRFVWAHWIIWFPTCGYAVSFLREVRGVALVLMFAAIAFTVLMESVWATIVFSAVAVAAYIAVTYVCIEHLRQPGRFYIEAFTAVWALPVGGLMALLANRFKRQRLALTDARRQTEQRNQELGERTRQLEATNLELSRVNGELVAMNSRADRIFKALAEALPGTVLDGKYQLRERIGAGGFGVVFSAMHLQLRRLVAVKVFRPAPGNDSAEAVERFRREAISACLVKHPNALMIFVILPRSVDSLVTLPSLSRSLASSSLQ